MKISYNTLKSIVRGFLIRESLIKEGGASGHMTHLFEDGSLTFGDLKNILKSLFSGKLYIEEKTDGQALAVTVKDGEVRAARNKATLKNPMSISEIASKFEGRGPIKDAFVNSMNDISNAIMQMSKEEIDSIFDNGQKFMAFEIIYPPTKNVVDYNNRCIIQLHGINVYDENFKKISEDKDAANRLFNFLKEHDALHQSVFEITNHTKLQLKDAKAAAASLKDIIGKLATIQGEYPDTTTLNDFVIDRYVPILKKMVQDAGLTNLDNDEFLRTLANRLAYTSPTKVPLATISQIAKDHGVDSTSKELKALVKTAEEQAPDVNQEIILPIETLVVDAGLQLMKNLIGFVSTDRSKSAEILHADLEKAIAEIEANKDKLTPSKLHSFQKNMAKLKKFGEDVVGVEGIVFLYNGKPYKMTGNFGVINQLLGLFKYGQEPTTESFDDKNRKKYGPTIALVAGSFKPPTAGHWYMVREYAKMADKVIVIISNPTAKNSIRQTANGGVITPEMSKKIFEIYAKRYGLDGKVQIEVSDQPSPINAMYDKIDKLSNCNIILGVSKKGNDLSRFNTAAEYVKDRTDVNLIDPVKTAIKPGAIGGRVVSASDLRNKIDDKDFLRKNMPPRLTDQDFNTILKILNGK